MQIFGRAHRVGAKTGSKVRSIVVRLHHYHERELVRKRLFIYSDALKEDNMGIGAQLPKELRDARKPFYPAMNKAKTEGENVKFLGTKLFIACEEYVEPNGASNPTPVDR